MKISREVFRAELSEIHRRRNLVVGRPARQSDRINFLAEAIRPIEELERANEELTRAEQSLWRYTEPLSKLPTMPQLIDFEVIRRNYESMRRRIGEIGLPERTAISEAKAKIMKALQGADEPTRPSPRLELVGLTLSGGGIRSATFNLGVLQAFAERGLLECIDYLSSVSGGGYTAGTLSCLLATSKRRSDAPEFPLRSVEGQEESPAIKHLRSGGSYLAPEGGLDKIRIPAVFLRGLLVNLLLLLPPLLVAVVATELVCGELLRGLKHQSWTWDLFYRYPLYFCVLMAFWTVAFPAVRTALKLSWDWRSGLEQAYASGVAALTGAFVIFSLPIAVLLFHQSSGSMIKSGIATAGSWSSLSVLLAVIIPTLAVAFGSGTNQALSTWRGRVMIYGIGIIGPIILFLTYLQIASWTIFSESKGLASFCLEITSSSTLCEDPAVKWVMEGLELANVFSIRPAAWTVVAVALCSFIYGVTLVDVNVTSLNGFYRDRISGAYLFRTQRNEDKDEVIPKDNLLLSQLNAGDVSSPYHIINTTLNLQSSNSMRGRSADFFMFSKCYVGSEMTGYCDTKSMENADGRLDLGTAIAISGAALAPNMGIATNRALTFLMTLLNVRTGYWLPNPMKVRSGFIRKFAGVGPLYFFLELVGLLNERRRYVNLSDGGHLENLGIYELLRRRCKVIIVCDAEADEKVTFGSFAKLIQFARIDGSIKIEIDMTDIRRNEGGLSKSHYALGTISYGETEKGQLLYLKASNCRSESEDIREYRVRHPSFPHESTSEQFFNEGQFEAYRNLGHHIASGVLGDGVRFTGVGAITVDEWIEDIRRRRALFDNSTGYVVS